MHSSYSLGSVPAIADRGAEQRDLLLSLTGPAARAILVRVNAFPREQRVAELNRVLASLDPAAPERMHRVTERLYRGGLSLDTSVERALSLTLADGAIEYFKTLGERRQSGAALPMGALGTVPVTPGPDAGAIVGDLLRGVACSSVLRDSISTLVGQNEGAQAHDATVTGFNTAGAMATCTPTTPEVLPPSDGGSSGMPLLVPVLLGVGALAVAGGFLWYTRK